MMHRMRQLYDIVTFSKKVYFAVLKKLKLLTAL